MLSVLSSCVHFIRFIYFTFIHISHIFNHVNNDYDGCLFSISDTVSLFIGITVMLYSIIMSICNFMYNTLARNISDGILISKIKGVQENIPTRKWTRSAEHFKRQSSDSLHVLIYIQ